MSRQRIVPCVWMDDQAEEAAAFYTDIFPGGRITAVAHYPETTENPGSKPRGSVLTVDFEIAGHRFTALNGGPLFTVNPSLSFFVFMKSVKETERLFSVLAAAGKELMPLDRYPFSELYGWVQDRFGVSWQVMPGEATEKATIVPCLMFADAVFGKAEEAMRRYAEVFPASRVERIERYTGKEDPEGSVKHGRFTIFDQPMSAMDSHVKQGYSFNEGLSLQVLCDDQPTVDHYWARLSEGGDKGQCGWLKDRYGLSWQVVPSGITDWLTSKDTAARDRAFNALMPMHKPDIGKLQAAFEGR